MHDLRLRRGPFPKRPGPVVVVVLDGIGWGPAGEGNAVHVARKPTLEWLWSQHPTIPLRAHGTAVGLPSDEDMGNSEVGHNALGAGRVFDQGAKLVDAALASGRLFQGHVWKELVGHCRARETPLHFIGLLSDGNVHSHIAQLIALLRQCRAEGLRRVRVHALLDGRDVPPQSAEQYLEQLEGVLAELNQTPGADYCIASGGGRMRVTMDRYGADWRIVERGWRAHVLGEGRAFPDARAALASFRAEEPETSDQFLGEFVVTREGRPVGPIEDGHGVVLFNFRGDRAIQISNAFEEEHFSAFDRGRVPKVFYAGMMQYDGDLNVPAKYLVSPPVMEATLGECLATNGITQLACSETQKFGHVTYFWNGNRSGKFDDATEEYLEVPSDRVGFDERPWMKAAEITDVTLQALRTGRYAFARLNYPNGDMVGHTGSLRAATMAVEAVDLCLGRLLHGIKELGGIALVTADHGNADEMLQLDRKTGAPKRDAHGHPVPRTSHTLNPVPFTVYDPLFAGEYAVKAPDTRAGLSHVAATALWLLGYEPLEGYDSPLVLAR
ncbi:MAG: 2,3-bisphosphoglycerate-independent phosphoglycerate mutase [Deltaproteobacteria bacterium]|nr:2,3-bisphosphoglycerate-independent phosphoglycerate mutase [Deltaproteobacteria bacterium]